MNSFGNLTESTGWVVDVPSVELLFWLSFPRGLRPSECTVDMLFDGILGGVVVGIALLKRMFTVLRQWLLRWCGNETVGGTSVKWEGSKSSSRILVHRHALSAAFRICFWKSPRFEFNEDERFTLARRRLVFHDHVER